MLLHNGLCGPGKKYLSSFLLAFPDIVKPRVAIVHTVSKWCKETSTASSCNFIVTLAVWRCFFFNLSHDDIIKKMTSLEFSLN